MRQDIKKLLEKETITASEAVERFGLDRSALLHKLRRGTLEGVRKGRAVLFDIQDVRPMIKKRRKK